MGYERRHRAKTILLEDDYGFGWLRGAVQCDRLALSRAYGVTEGEIMGSRDVTWSAVIGRR